MADRGKRSRRGAAATGKERGLTVEVSTEERPRFDQPLTAYHFNAAGHFLQRATVEGNRLTLDASAEEAAHGRLFIAPRDAALEGYDLSPAVLERLGAHEAILRPGTDKLIDVIRIPGGLIDLWPWCFCLVRGRVVRASDGRPVCNARVHICEVDRIPIWIRQLPELELVRLRDDLIAELRKPVLPPVDPRGPFPPRPGPGPDPAADINPLFRAQAKPLATGRKTMLEARDIEEARPSDVDRRLFSASPAVLREALVENWKLILPYLCYWRWWWGWFRCDELAVLTTDPNGRFQTTIPYLCSGDKPDLYFWVEYDLGNGFETVYEPPIACWTYWDYPCGSDVTISISDQRVPGCNDEPDLPGKQVWVLSIGRTVSIGEIHTSGPQEGMVSEPWDSTSSEDYSFGGKLEPRVWFSRDSLINDSGITHYLWSVRPVGTVTWTPLTRQVIRHYTDIATGTLPIDVMGPEPGGTNAGRFRIRPTAVPSANPNDEWVVADEREDLATAHFETSAPASSGATCGTADPNAGKYELKLELFDSAGNLVDMDAHGITLRYATTEAPFGTGNVNTVPVDNYHRITNGAGNTVAFRMVLHVDNSRSGADIAPITGSGITVDAACGIVTMTGSNPTVDMSFAAGRPGGLARFRFNTQLGVSTPIPEASTGGKITDPGTTADSGVPDVFGASAPCNFSRTGIPAIPMLRGCPQGAYAENLYVWALTQDGYSRLSGLDASDVAAFMLTTPCPPCDDEDHGHGHGHGRGGRPA